MRRFTRALSAGIGVALVGAALGVVPPAGAQSPEAPYSCSAPVVGPQTSISRYDTTLPEIVYVGESEPVDVKVFSNGSAPWGVLKTGWDLIGLRKVAATSYMGLTIGGVTKDTQVDSPVVNVVHGQDAILNGEGSWGVWTPPTTPQLVEATMATSYGLALKLLKADGSQAIDAGVQACTWVGADPAQLIADTVRVMARTTMTVSAETLDIIEDDPLVVEARVSASAGTVAGKVTFTVGPKTAVATVTNGVARATITGLPLGSHPLNAVYAPTQALLYDAASVAEQLVTVAPPVPATVTTTTMTLDRASVTTDDETKATVQVTSPDGAPSGSARVVAGGKAYTAPLVAGSATVTIPRLRSGSYQVTGTFVPTNPRQYAPSSATPVSLTVIPGAGGDLVETSMWLELPKRTLTVGSSMSATAVVSSSEPVRGRVDFTFAGRTMSSPVVNGRAVVSLPYLGIGNYQLEAKFVPAGGSGFVASEAESLSFEVEAKQDPTPTPTPTPPTPTDPVVITQPTSTRIVAPAASTVGGTVAVSAAVSVAGGQPAAGTVTFAMGGLTVSAAVVGGQASASFPASAVGAQAVQADFVPASSAQGASSDSAFVQVARGSSRTAVTAKVNAKKAKAAVRVAVTAPGDLCKAPVTITLSRGKARATVKRVLTCAGTASATFGTLKPGKHTVKVTFAGSAQADGSTATMKVRVKAAKKR